MTPEAWGERYLAALPRTAAPAPGHLPALPPGVWFRRPPHEPEAGLRDLYDTGVRAGHGETRALLEERIEGFERRLDEALGWRRETEAVREEMSISRQQAARDNRDLQQALDWSRARIAELEGSTVWRATKPVRVVGHAAKGLVRSFRELPQRARRIVPRLATAQVIAREQGVTELARVVAHKLARRQVTAGFVARPGLAPRIAPLVVPAAAEPLVSVIVPTYGQDLHTYTCLVALAEEARDIPLEVIVADDAAPRPAAEALAGVRGVRFERAAENQGYLRNTNRGASLARGKYLLLLNNDAVLAPGSIAAMLDVFERHADAGAVGAKLVWPDGRLQEAGGIVWRDGSAWNWGRGQDPAHPRYNYLREADYCSAACLMVPRALWESLAGFDERYAPAYYEDTDLCFRVREAGRRVFYQPAAEAVHFEGISHGADPDAGVKRHQVLNRGTFAQRWQARLARHRPNGVMPQVECDRDASLRVLLVEACMVTPDQDSGSLRTFRMLGAMRELGWKPTFVAANLETREPYTRQLETLGVEVIHHPWVGSVEQLLRDRGAEFDVVIVARYYVASPLLTAIRRHAPRALVVFDTLDLHYVRNRRLAQLNGSTAMAQSAEAIYREEIECVRRSDVTWVVSEVEREMLLREVPDAQVLVQSNIHDAVGARKPFAEREGLLFVGGFRHPPNVDAARFLVEEIMPRLREQLPGVPVYIVGSSAPRVVQDLAGPGVEFVGFVPDLAAWLERCRVSVSPLRYGAGVKGKVNQAMAHGLPVVATRMSIEGMHVVDGEDALVADDPEAFAQAVVRLYRDEALWNRISSGGLDNIRRHFSTEVARRALQALPALAARRAT